MKTNQPDLQMFESTYAMIVRSEERERSASEIIAYGALILSAFFAMMQIARQPFTVPTNFAHASAITQSAAAQPEV